MCLLNVMTFFCGTTFILWYNIRLTCLTVSLPSSALFTRSNETCHQKPKRSFRQKSIWIFFRYFISFVFIYGTKLYTKLNQYRVLSKSQNWPAKPWLFPRVFDEKLFSSCMLLRIWLIWLDALIKREILITTGMAWPVSSYRWKAPYEKSFD